MVLRQHFAVCGQQVTADLINSDGSLKPSMGGIAAYLSSRFLFITLLELRFSCSLVRHERVRQSVLAYI